MSKQWLLAAGRLLAAFLMVSTSVLALSSDHKDSSWPLVAPGISAGQGDSKEALLSVNSRVPTSAEATSPETSELHKLPPGLSLNLDPFSHHHTSLETSGASGRVTSGPTASPQAKPEAHRTPKSQLASSVAEPGTTGRLALSLLSTSPSSQRSTQSLLLPPSSPTSSPSASHPSLLLYPSPSPLPPTSPSQVRAPVSPSAPIAAISPGPSVPMFPSTIPDSQINISSLVPAGLKSSPMVTESVTPQWTVHPGPVHPPSPAPTAALSLSGTSSLPSLPPTSGSPPVTESPGPGGADLTQSSAPAAPGQAISRQDSASSSPGLSHVFHSVTFRISSENFSTTLQNPTSQEHQRLSKKIRDQLEPVYCKAFPSFKGIGLLVFRPSSVHTPSSVAVNASLVFGGHALNSTACQVLWILYRKVKAAWQMLGNMSLAENSLTSDRCTLTDLSLETVSIRFTTMRSFRSQFLVPGSASFDLLKEQILQQVTPVVSGFYQAHPQESPLLLFRNADQWVDVYIEYKFPVPIPRYLQGLANHLAQNVLDSTLQKSSIMANGEKAQLVLYEMRLQILGRPFTNVLKDKTSAEFQELQGQLTRGLTTILRHLQNLSQVVVEAFQPDPLTARVEVTFFRAAPAKVLVQVCVFQGLHTLWEAEGLSVKMVIPDLGTPNGGASGQSSSSIPSYAVALIVVSLLLITFALILVLKQRICCRMFILGDRKSHTQSSTAQ